jgi:hypothetical protein
MQPRSIKSSSYWSKISTFTLKEIFIEKKNSSTFTLKVVLTETK